MAVNLLRPTAHELWTRLVRDGDALYLNSEGTMMCLSWPDGKTLWQDKDSLKLGEGGSLAFEPNRPRGTIFRFTLPQALTQYVDAYGGPIWNVQLAATTLTVIPVLVVFVVARH